MKGIGFTEETSFRNISFAVCFRPPPELPWPAVVVVAAAAALNGASRPSLPAPLATSCCCLPSEKADGALSGGCGAVCDDEVEGIERRGCSPGIPAPQSLGSLPVTCLQADSIAVEERGSEEKEMRLSSWRLERKVWQLCKKQIA